MTATPANSARGARPRSAALTRREILDRALQIVDAHGVEALTMRRLAAEVGVEPMSLYHHIDGKGALLDGVVERVFAELPSIEANDGAWEEQVRHHARRFALGIDLLIEGARQLLSR